MENFDLEKELINVVKKMNRSIIKEMDTDALMFVYANGRKSDSDVLGDTRELIKLITGIVGILDKKLSTELLNSLFDDIENELDFRFALPKKEVKSAKESKENMDEVIKNEEEKIKDYFKRIGLNGVDVRIVEMQEDD